MVTVSSEPTQGSTMSLETAQGKNAPANASRDAESSEHSWPGDDEDEDEDDIYCDSLDDIPQKVDDKLFIGSMAAEHNYEGLQAAGITHVLQVAEGLSPSHSEQGLSYRTICVQDMPCEDLVAHFPRCFDFISEAHAQGGGVLIHCVAGVSRSATVVMGWLMWRHKLSVDEAFRRVHRVRPWISPNSGFRAQLERFAQLGCDAGRWTAWRHEWREEPLTLGLLALQREAGLERMGCGGDGGGLGSGEPLPSL